MSKVIDVIATALVVVCILVASVVTIACELVKTVTNMLEKAVTVGIKKRHKNYETVDRSRNKTN